MPLAVRSALLAVIALAAAAPTASAGIAGPPQEVAAVATPWELLPLADGRTLAVERSRGRITIIEGPGTGTVLFENYPDTFKFLGLVAHPDFASNRFLYLYVNRFTGGPSEEKRNRILRLRDSGSGLVLDRIIFDGIDSDGNHDGGRMAFGPDGKLYVTTGDVHQPDRPQNLQSLNGKILRLEAPGTDADGSPPADNPFIAQGGNARFVWSYGHRHPQGLAFDAQGRLFETEHGPSGETYGPTYPGGDGRNSRDEVNLIEKGVNYGWPIISGTESRPNMRAPLATSDTGPTWAPGGLAVGSDGHLYVPMLAGAHLREFTPDGITVAKHFENTFGRLRVAAMDCRGLLFAQDGDAAKVRRVPLDPAPQCPAAPAPVAPVAPVTSTPAAATPLPTPRAALQRLLARAAADLRRGGLRRLARGRSFSGRAGGVAPGRVTLRLVTAKRRARTLATGATRYTDRRTRTVRARPTSGGRAMLRRRTRMTVVLRVSHRAADGRLTSVSARRTLR